MDCNQKSESTHVFVSQPMLTHHIQLTVQMLKQNTQQKKTRVLNSENKDDEVI